MLGDAMATARRHAVELLKTAGEKSASHPEHSRHRTGPPEPVTFARRRSSLHIRGRVGHRDAQARPAQRRPGIEHRG